MDKLIAQLKETTYSFPGDDEEVRLVADEDDEVRTTLSHHRSRWRQRVLRNLLFALRFYIYI
jgi:hypothetical protein